MSLSTPSMAFLYCLQKAPFFQPRVLLTVTDEDAQDYGISREEVANLWQDELDRTSARL